MERITIAVPTFNRRPFIPLLLYCIQHQTYPHNLIDVIIADDGTDIVSDIIPSIIDSIQIKYYRLPKKTPLGAKRNFLNSRAEGSIIVYFDDDDYYPPNKLQAIVDAFHKNPSALISGAKEMYIWSPHEQHATKFKTTRATAATLAFKRTLLAYTQFQSDAVIAEEPAFTRNFPMAHVPTKSAIVAITHPQNTCDRQRILSYHTPATNSDQKAIGNLMPLDVIALIRDQIMPQLASYMPGDRATHKPLETSIGKMLLDRVDHENELRSILESRITRIPMTDGHNFYNEYQLYTALKAQTKIIDKLKEQLSIANEKNRKSLTQQIISQQDNSYLMSYIDSSITNKMSNLNISLPPIATDDYDETSSMYYEIPFADCFRLINHGTMCKVIAVIDNKTYQGYNTYRFTSPFDYYSKIIQDLPISYEPDAGEIYVGKIKRMGKTVMCDFVLKLL